MSPRANVSPSPIGRGSIATLLLLSSMTVMAGATISPALPSIERGLGEGPRSELLVRLVLTLPALFTALGAPVAGLIIDRFGRKRLLFAAVTLYAISGASGLVARTLPELLVGRAGLGLGVGGVLTTATTLIADYFRGEERSRVMGWQSAFIGAGGVAFVTLGGLLTDVSWRAPFAVYLFALLYLPLVALYLPEPRRLDGQARHDAQENGTRHDAHDELGGGTRPDAHDAVSGDASRPGSTEGTLHRPTVAFVYLVGFLGMIFFFAMPVQIPFHLELLGPVTAAQVGLALGAMTAVSVGTSLLYPRIRRKLRFPAIFGLLFLLLGLGYLAIAAAPSYGTAIAGLFVAGAGAGLLVPNLHLWTSHLAPEAMRGRVLGALGLCLFLGQFVSPMVTQPLAEERGYPGMYGTLGTVQLLMAAVFVVGVVLSGRGRR